MKGKLELSDELRPRGEVTRGRSDQRQSWHTCCLLPSFLHVHASPHLEDASPSGEHPSLCWLLEPLMLLIYSR